MGTITRHQVAATEAGDPTRERAGLTPTGPQRLEQRPLDTPDNLIDAQGAPHGSEHRWDP